MKRTDPTLAELEVAVEALIPIIGEGHVASIDEDTGFIEIKPCGLSFERVPVEVSIKTIVKEWQDTVLGYQPQVLRHISNYPHEPDDYDYQDLGEPQAAFHAAVVEAACELAAEMVGNRLADWSEAQAWEQEQQERENFDVHL